MRKIIFRTLLIVIVLIPIFIVGRFAMLGSSSKEGQAPGLQSGQLLECPDKPNCINSEFVEDSVHYLPPLDYPANKADQVMEAMKSTIEEVGGEVTLAEEGYISATFTSSIFGFVDDFEVRIDPSLHKIHIRSASRVGYSDFDANKKRVESVTALFHNKL